MQNNSSLWTCPVFSPHTARSGLFPGVQRIWEMLWPLVSSVAGNTCGSNPSPSLMHSLASVSLCGLHLKGFWPSWQPFPCPHPSLFSPHQFPLSNCSSQVRRVTLLRLNCDVQGDTSWSVWKKPWTEEVPLGLWSKQVDQTGNIPLAVLVSPWI